MKSAKNIIFAMVIALVVVAQIYYLLTSFKRDKEQIAANNEQIQSTQIRIDQLEERLARHEESKKELAQIQVEQTAMEDKIPNQDASSKFTSNFMDYMKIFDCVDVKLSSGESEVITSDIGDIYKLEYNLEFVSTFSSSEKFVKHLKGMYQTCNVMSYNFDTSVQQDTGKEKIKYILYFDKDINSVGKTTIVFDIYYRMDGKTGDEVYHSEYLGKINGEPFKNAKAASEDEDSEGTSDTADSNDGESPSQDYVDVMPADFILNIGDILTSGDVYKLSGPGDEEGSYVGLNSKVSVDVTVTVYDDSYELSIKDKEGNTQKSSVKYAINTPSFRIISSMRPLQEVMPAVHIYINNYSSTAMNVSLSGTMLDNIHVYDSKKQEVQQGQTKGNISLT